MIGEKLSEEDIDGIFKRATDGIMKIAKRVKDQEPQIDYSKRWFKTRIGKNFFEQIKEIELLNWELFILSFPQKQFFKEIGDLFKNEKTRREILNSEKKTKKKEDEKWIKFFEEHGVDIFDSLQKEIKGYPKFTERKLQLFCATFSLSLYAYIDNYCLSIIEKLLKKKKTREHLILKIEIDKKIMIDKSILNKKKDILERVRKEFPTNPLHKLRNLLKYFNLNYRFSRLRNRLFLASYYELCDGFTRIRHKLAHRIPVLNPEIVEKTSKSVHNKIMKYSEVVLNKIEFENESPDYTQPVLDLFIEWFKSLVFPISSIYTFIHSSVITLALFDQVLGEIIRS